MDPAGRYCLVRDGRRTHPGVRGHPGGPAPLVEGGISGAGSPLGYRSGALSRARNVPRAGTARCSRGGAPSSDNESSSPSADPEEQTQDQDGKKAEEEHRPDHDDDHLDRPPPAHHAPYQRRRSRPCRSAESPPGLMMPGCQTASAPQECAGSSATANTPRVPQLDTDAIRHVLVTSQRDYACSAGDRLVLSTGNGFPVHVPSKRRRAISERCVSGPVPLIFVPGFLFGMVFGVRRSSEAEADRWCCE